MTILPAFWFADVFKGGERRDQRGFMNIILNADSGQRLGRLRHGVDMQPDASRRIGRPGNSE